MSLEHPSVVVHFTFDDIADEDYDFPILVGGQKHEPPQPTIYCIDFLVKPGPIGPVEHWPTHAFVINPTYIRFDASTLLDATDIVSSLGPGGELRKLFARVHEAMIRDRDLVGACRRVTSYLRGTG